MKKIVILYEDKDLIAVSKPAKLLTISTDKEKTHTLYQEVSAYVKKQHPKNKVFIVHRLDRDTSGIVVFAKNEKMKQILQAEWQERALVREYIAIVTGAMPMKKGIIKNYLYEDKTLYVRATSDPKRGKLAITEYEVLAKNKKYSLVKIHIKTGRKNQIRVHLKDLGYPIVGDKKYGDKKTSVGRLLLHASYLKLLLPNGKVLEITARLPKEMQMFEEKS